MRLIPILVIMMSLCINVSCFAQDRAWDNHVQTGDDELIAFIGAPVFLEERHLNKTMEFKLPSGEVVTRILPNLDTRYEARFHLIERVLGSFEASSEESSSIDFVAYDHYSRPSFHKPEYALLFLIKYQGEWLHNKYIYYSVQRTTDGDWATCGDPYKNYRDRNPDTAYAPEALSFIEPFKYFAHHEGTECKAGARVADLVEFQIETRFLPNRRRKICQEKIGDFGPIPMDKMDAYKAHLDRIGRCIETLAFKGFP